MKTSPWMSSWARMSVSTSYTSVRNNQKPIVEVDSVVAQHVISIEQRADGSQRVRQHRLAHMHEVRIHTPQLSRTRQRTGPWTLVPLCCQELSSPLEHYATSCQCKPYRHNPYKRKLFQSKGVIPRVETLQSPQVCLGLVVNHQHPSSALVNRYKVIVMVSPRVNHIQTTLYIFNKSCLEGLALPKNHGVQYIKHRQPKGKAEWNRA